MKNGIYWTSAIIIIAAIFFVWGVHRGQGFARTACVNTCECPHMEVAP